MKPGLKMALGAAVSACTIGLVLVYDFYVKDKIDSVEVAVVTMGAEIDKSATITPEMVSIERREKKSLLEDVILAEEIDSIIGKEAKQDIVGNSMISAKMIDFDELVPNEKEGEAIRPLISDMIYAQPGSLRRKDNIDIYLINYTSVSPVSGPSTVNSADAPKDEEKEDKEKDEKTEKAAIQGLKPFLSNVKVVYVKDSGNKEVVSEVTANENERLNATSTISDIEVILNNDDFAKLMNAMISNKSKLYITYH